ncbi:MAG: GTP-binding protein [Desulfomicrobium escambiense]|nr:GTP-binding protein [Desulfomicrobium escambiense]
MAHIDAGKTTDDRADPLLHRRRLQDRRGPRGHRRRWTGWPQEQERGITITSAATTCFWNDHRHQHHRHARPRGLHHGSGAVAARARRRRRGLRCAWPACEPQSETVWRQADKYHVPRICLHEQDGPDRGGLLGAVASMIETGSAPTPVPVQIPIGAEDTFTGVIDLVRMQAILYRRRDAGRRVRRSATSRPTCSTEAHELPREADRGRRRDRRRRSWTSTSTATDLTPSEIMHGHPPGHDRS